MNHRARGSGDHFPASMQRDDRFFRWNEKWNLKTSESKKTFQF